MITFLLLSILLLTHCFIIDPADLSCMCSGGCSSDWCYLWGGPGAKTCRGALKSQAGNYYYTYDKEICDKAKGMVIF